MKIQILVVLAALLGIASSDMVCAQFEISSCFALICGANHENSICPSIKNLTDCYHSVSRECDVENSTIIQEIMNIHTETCIEGSEMNNLYKKHRKCIFQDTQLLNVTCLKQMIAAALEVGYGSETRDYKTKVMEVTCRYADSANECMENNVNLTCGNEAAEFKHNFTEAGMRLSKMVCEEVGVDTNELHYAHQQHHDHSVQALPPHIQPLSAIDPQAASIQIASTVALREFLEPSNAATINASLHLVYVLLATIFVKLFSSY